MSEESNDQKHVVIAGAGFAGLQLAKGLSNKPGIKVTLIDQQNYHQFQPLFYQVATAGLNASDISFPLRKIFQNSLNVTVRLSRIERLIPNENIVITDDGPIFYDDFVLATGCDTNFFGKERLRKYVLPMKSTVEAIQIRHRLIEMLELAAKNHSRQQGHLFNIVVVGGGPTGVELSGALSEMKRKVLPKDFPELDFTKMNIYLVEGSGATLSTMSRKSQTDSKKYLIGMGVHVWTDKIVEDYDGNTLRLSGNTKLDAGLVIWAAGVKGNIPNGINIECLTPQHRVKVDCFHRVFGYSNIYAIGDVSVMFTGSYPKGHPQVCKVANDQGKNLSRNLLLMRQGRPVQAFSYHDLGSMATVGRNKAVVDDFPFRGVHFRGALAWLAWMGFHLLQLIGAKNRVQVLVNWTYSYFTYDQNLRLLLKPRTTLPAPSDADAVKLEIPNVKETKSYPPQKLQAKGACSI